MKFPLNEEAFILKYLSGINNPDNGDREVANATVKAINRAYYAGLAEGREENALNLETV